MLEGGIFADPPDLLKSLPSSVPADSVALTRRIVEDEVTPPMSDNDGHVDTATPVVRHGEVWMDR
jgi:hypothetical protein